MSNEIKEKEEYEKFARDHRKELDAQEVKLGDIVVFKTGNRAFEVIGKYIVPDDRLWRVDVITENDPPTPDRNRKYRLVAVDCPNVMLDEIPEIYVESYSEKLERELEEQRKEALKMNRNEIKQGDKVRVSKDAPRIYTPDWVDAMFDLVLKVTEVEDGNAMVEFAKRTPYRTVLTTIPTKYLVKVDAEAKEAKYKVGNWVMISGVFNPQLNGMIGWISRIDKDGNKVSFQDGRFAIVEDKYLTLITQPTEQTEAEEDARIRLKEAELYEFRKAELDRVLHPEKYYTYEVTIDNVAMNWQRYEADLAKEVVLKVANNFNDPEQAADYAVSVAKAVVEGLKRE